MLSLENDYSEGACPEILERLVRTNLEQTSGYGMDAYCESAKEKIRKATECPEAEIQFLVGGTQTNQIVIDSMLQPYEGVIAAETGHVSQHEAGAIEYTGHKVLTLPSHTGKIEAGELESLVKTFYRDENHEHMVFPGMIYISHPTEYGTLYTAQELKAISEVARTWKLPMYMDGARLGYGLMSPETDVTLPMVADLCDVFYIGGTKVGALFGEAVVFTKGNMPEHFLTRVKMHGGLLAKGWLLGLQFDTLFTDGLYFRLSEHAVSLAMKLRNGIRERGIPVLHDSPTNQQFIILENDRMEELLKRLKMSYWEAVDETHTALRLATSWATKEETVEKALELLSR